MAEHAEWFARERGISAETLEKMRVGSKQEWLPQTGGTEWCICFNYYEQGEWVNTKFRNLRKNFKMIAGAKVIPYNIDGIYGCEECFITEGEIDALSLVEVGITNVISVPSGANRNLGWMDRFMASLYDVNGSAAFYNKSDFGWVVERDYQEDVTRIHIEKVRFKHLGNNKEKAEFMYNRINGRYTPCKIDKHTKKVCEGEYDNEPWI